MFRQPWFEFLFNFTTNHLTMILRLKIIFYLFLMQMCFVSSFSQAQQLNETFWEKVYFGGNFGLQFGNQTLVNVNPIVGYRITEKLSAGVSATYIYYHFKDPYYSIDYTSNIYGGSIFTRYFVLENIFAHVEGEVLNLEVPQYFNNSYSYVRDNVFGFYVGGGLRQPMGERSSLNILLLYNLNEDVNSPYQNPIIRIGFGFGI